MEDRTSTGLYLEMSDSSPESYAEKRVKGVLALSGVASASWWENLRPGRDEFSRRLPEFSALGIYEVDAGFEAPETPAGIRGLHFRRTARPGQGNLSGKPTLGLELVLISPKTEQGAQALRDWADFVHIRHIAAASVPGFTMITPYENVTRGEPRYMHFYEMDRADAEEAFQQMVPVTQERRIGRRGSELWNEWFMHDQLVIDYVNTFRRLGSTLSDISPAPGRRPGAA